MSSTKIYKIRNKETGLFSEGGGGMSIWSKQGKTWSHISHIKNHLKLFKNHRTDKIEHPYKNAEIVEIEVSYDECNIISVDEFIKNNMKEIK